MLKWLKNLLRQESPTSDEPRERRFVYKGFHDVYGPMAAKAAEKLVDVCNEVPEPLTHERKKEIIQNHWNHFSQYSSDVTCSGTGYAFVGASSCSGSPLREQINYFKRNIVLDGPNWEIEELPVNHMTWCREFLCTYERDGKKYYNRGSISEDVYRSDNAHQASHHFLANLVKGCQQRADQEEQLK